MYIVFAVANGKVLGRTEKFLSAVIAAAEATEAGTPADVKKVAPTKIQAGLGVGTTVPEYRRPAPAGQHWVKSSRFGNWVLEAIDTPFTCSVASETYWAQ